jgi:tetratricopeptide (TPR) repeat protein
MKYEKKYWMQCAILVLLALCCISLAQAKDSSPAEWLKKGNDLRANSQYQEALDAYNQALSLDPNYGEAWNNKGNVLYDLGRYEEALEAINKSLSINPDYAFAWNNKGLILQKIGRSQEALDAYDKALSINPDFTKAQSNREKLLNGLLTGDENLTTTTHAAKEPTSGPGLIRLGIKPMPAGIGFSVLAVGIGILVTRKKP